MPYQQNQNPRNRVNTDGIQIYGDTSTIRFDFWSQCVTVKIHPKREDGTDGRSVYDYKKRVMVVLPIESAITLGRYLKDEIIPAIKNKEAKSIGIQSSKVNMIYVSTGVKETGDVDPYVALFCDIDESRKPQKMEIFKFRKRRVFRTYNPETGEVEMDDDIVADINLMAEFMLSAIFLNNVTAHADAYTNATSREADATFFSDLGAKMGVAYQQPTNIVSRSAMKADPWTSAPAAGADAVEAAPMSSVGSLDEISSLVSKSTYKKLKKRLQK